MRCMKTNLLENEKAFELGMIRERRFKEAIKVPSGAHLHHLLELIHQFLICCAALHWMMDDRWMTAMSEEILLKV